MTTELRLDRIASTSSNIVPAAAPVRQPDHIVDFAVHYLRLRLFPRQALVLKLMTLATNLMTDYDHGVVNSWMAGFRRGDCCVKRKGAQFGRPSLGPGRAQTGTFALISGA